MLASFLFSANAAAADKTSWSYEGLADGQDNWASLSPDFAKCETGTNQSPVVISYTKPADLPPLTFSYIKGKVTLRRDFNTLEITFSNSNTLNIAGDEYSLKSIQFHSPNEHTLLDKYYAMEIHLLHESRNAKKLNVAILVEPGKENTELKSLTSSDTLPFGQSKDAELNASAFLPLSLGYYAYTGSITHPPCTENVEWRVLKKPLQMSYAQMDYFIKQLGRNSRLEQPIYNRTIYETKY